MWLLTYACVLCMVAIYWKLVRFLNCVRQCYMCRVYALMVFLLCVVRHACLQGVLRIVLVYAYFCDVIGTGVLHT